MGFLDFFGLGDAPEIKWDEKGRQTFTDPQANSLKTALINQALGIGPSAAQLQMQAGLAQAQRGATAQTASQRGLTAAQRARLSKALYEDMAMRTNEQSGILRAQEQQNFLGMANQFQQAREDQLNQLSLQKATAQAGFDQAAAASRLSAVGGALGGAASMATMFSDVNTKENISDVKTDDVKDFLNALKGYQYDYKVEYRDSPMAGKGRRTGVMAQDLEKSSIGKTVVSEVEVNGSKIKAVDTNKFVHALAASLSDVNNRLNKLEK